MRERTLEPHSAHENTTAVVVTGEPIAAARARRGDYADLIAEALGESRSGLSVLDARAGDVGELRRFGAIVVTGSAASVTDAAPWMQALAARLREAVEARRCTLGICFGHQLLAEALGGRVDKNPRGREIGTVPLTLLAEDPLFASAPTPPLVNMTHSDTIAALPAGARVLATTELDACAAVRFAETAWGVQFHPEIDGDVLADYVNGRWQTLLAEGLDAHSIRSGVSDAPFGRSVLPRFAAMARGVF